MDVLRGLAVCSKHQAPQTSKAGKLKRNWSRYAAARAAISLVEPLGFESVFAGNSPSSISDGEASAKISRAVVSGPAANGFKLHEDIGASRHADFKVWHQTLSFAQRLGEHRGASSSKEERRK